MKKIRVKVKPKCNCEDHYLELCQSFDGITYQYKRYCYKCNRSWNYTKRIEDKCVSYISDSSACRSRIIDTYGNEIAVPRMEVKEDTVMFDDGNKYCYVHTLNKDGTIGNLIKLVRYK